jgi:hypothetical protein
MGRHPTDQLPLAPPHHSDQLAGVSLETVSLRLGHADISFTRRTYIHALHTRVEEDAARLDTWLTAQFAAKSNVVPIRRTG